MSTVRQSGTGTGNGSNFAQTYNRLSLFLKEKGSLRDLSFGINGKFDATARPETSPVITPATTTTVDLLSNMENPGQKSSVAEKSTSQLPQLVSLDSFCKVDDATNRASSSKPEPPTVSEIKTAQMTIFYGGQVLVFDDFPADRARDLMRAANGKGNSQQIENPVEPASTSNSQSTASGAQERNPAQLQANGSDLPIARRASLHKFLEKRKDRATVRAAPYQLHNPSPAAAAGASSSKTEHKFDLNL